jgi:hypothetical protein
VGFDGLSSITWRAGAKPNTLFLAEFRPAGVPEAPSSGWGTASISVDGDMVDKAAGTEQSG